MQTHAGLLHSMPNQAKVVLASTDQSDPTLSAQGILLPYCTHSFCNTLLHVACIKLVLFS